MSLKDWDAEQWSAFGTCAALLFYVVAGVIAWRQVREAQRLREEQARPYVIVDFEFSQILVFITIMNIGNNPAYGVKIAFDKPVLGTLDDEKDLSQMAVFTDPIPMMAPGRKIRVPLGTGPELTKQQRPMRYEARVTYRDGRGRKIKPVDPACILDLAVYNEAALVPKGIHELANELREVRLEMRKWTASGGRGLISRTIDYRQEQRIENRPFLREQARRVRSDEGWLAYVHWQIDRQLMRRGWR